MSINLNLRKDGKYLLACSFGPDSMALFSLLLKGGYNFEVAHVNYGLRGEESDNETKALLAFASLHNITLHIHYTKGYKPKSNFQEYARDVRYEFCRKIIEEDVFDALLTGHNQDDFIETYLMQKEKKVTTFHYGIREESYIYDILVKRPLIHVAKEKLEQYCQENNVPYAIDSSNLTALYKRNDIRLNVTKTMKEAKKEALFGKIREANFELEEQKVILQGYINYNKILLSDFLNLNDDFQHKLLYLLFLENEMAAHYTGGKANNIISAIKKQTASLMFNVALGVYFVKAYSYFTLINMIDYKPYEYILSSPERLETTWFHLHLESNLAKTKIFKEDYPLTISPAKKEDFYQISGYNKKVSRMYVDMKMPRYLRLVWPIVKNKDGRVIYVPRYRDNYERQDDEIFTIFTE